MLYISEPLFSGADSISFSVSDGTADSSPAIVSIDVLDVNQPPVSIPLSLVTAEDSALAIELTASDADADTLAYEIVIEPVHGVLVGVPPAISYQPHNNYSGSDSFTFIARDDGSFSPEAAITIDVQPVNDTPEVQNIELVVQSGQPVSTLLQGVDVDSDVLTYRLLSQPASGEASLDGDTVAYLSVATFDGVVTLEYVANDGEVDSAPGIIRIVVERDNTAPVAVAGDDSTARVGDTVALNGAGSTDPEGDALAYHWTIVSAPADSTAGLIDNTEAQSALTVDLDGDYVVRLVVNDGEFDSLPDEVVISVSPATPNQPPVARPSFTLAYDEFERFVIVLDGSESSDPDGDELTYQWTVIESHPDYGPSLDDSTSISPLWATEPWRHVVSLIVNDGQVDSAPVELVIPENATFPPSIFHSIFINDQEFAEGTLLNLAVEVFGDGVFTYAWQFDSKPTTSEASFSDAESLQTDLSVDAPGTYRIRFVADNGQPGGRASVAWAFRVVSGSNQRPIASLGDQNEITITVDDQPVLVQLDGRDSVDPDGDALQFEWLLTVPPGSTATLDDPTSATPTFLADVRGYYSIELQVNDGQEYADNEPLLDVLAVGSQPNNLPVADAGPDKTGPAAGVAFTFDGSGSSDADGDFIEYVWSVQS